MQEALRFRLSDAEPLGRAEIIEQARFARRGPRAASRGLSLTIRDLRKSFGPLTRKSGLRDGCEWSAVCEMYGVRYQSLNRALELEEKE